jgi:hypothetical protein
MINLRDRNIEAVAETIFEALYYVPLLLEGVRRFHVNVESENTDDRLQVLSCDGHFLSDSLHCKCLE